MENPLHLGSLALTVPAVLEQFKFDMKDGDVVATNDPYGGGTQLQDLTFVAPFVVGNAIVLYLVTRLHVPDLGGKVAGNYCPDATEVWVEGVPVPPVKLYRNDRPVHDALTTLLLNSRYPDQVRHGVDTAVAAIRLGARRMDEVVGSYGLDATRAALAYAQDHAERMTRAEIARWVNGTYHGEASLDTDGTAADAPVTVRVDATVDDETLTLDFTASDDQRPSFVNSSLGNTTGNALLAVFAAIGDGVPRNGGALRAVRMTCQRGTVTHAQRPAAVCWSPTHCGAEIAAATAAALRSALPDTLASVAVPRSLVQCRPVDDRQERIDLGTWSVGGCGGATGIDGWLLPGPASRSVLPSAEQWETDTGMAVRTVQFVPDTAGHGRWRGAPAVDVELDLPADHVYTLCVQGRANPVPGVAGGTAGAPGGVWFEIDDESAPAPPVAVEAALPGSRVRIRTGGGGGYGDPAERSDDAVREDVADGYLTAATAERVYGAGPDQESVR